MLNPESPVPLYHQLAELLGERIRSGELGPGARLPSEPQLSRQHRIGRPTVRQATELLVQRGLIERRRGAGTFVRTTPATRVDLFTLAGTLSSFREGGVPLEARLLQRVTRKLVAQDPDNPFSEREAFHFARLSRVRGAPVLLERLYLDPGVFPDLPRWPLAGESLSRLVEERYFLKPESADQTFRVAYPNPETRKALKVPNGRAVLLVQRTLHFPNAPAAIFAELYCRTEKLSFSQTLRDYSHG